LELHANREPGNPGHRGARLRYDRRPIRSPVRKERPLSDSHRNSRDPAGRPPWLLLVGAAIGLALATFGLLETRRDARALPAGAAAMVGDRTIRLVDYRRVLAGVESDLRNPIDEAMRRRVLDRMIDEELLVQRALDLGLAVIDRRVRGELTSGLIDSIVSESDADEPDRAAVVKHFEENIDFFTRPGRLRVQTIYFSVRRDGDPSTLPAIERARLAADRLAKTDDDAEVAAIEAKLGDEQVSPVPNVLLPGSKVRDYLGPTLLQALEQQEVGVWSAPIQNQGGFYVARLIEREPAIIPELEDVETLVRQDLKRREGDRALRRYLDDLRSETPVSINEAIFALAGDS
jgi:PPIC-type PPIASE domain/SurA-like N-terminal domain